MSKSSSEKKADEIVRKIIVEKNLDKDRHCPWDSIENIEVEKCFNCTEHICKIKGLIQRAININFWDSIEQGRFERVLNDVVEILEQRKEL